MIETPDHAFSVLSETLPPGFGSLTELFEAMETHREGEEVLLLQPLLSGPDTRCATAAPQRQAVKLVVDLSEPEFARLRFLAVSGAVRHAVHVSEPSTDLVFEEHDIERVGRGLLDQHQVDDLELARTQGGNSALGPSPQELRAYEENQGGIDFSFLQRVARLLPYPEFEVRSTLTHGSLEATYRLQEVNLSFRVRNQGTQQGRVSLEVAKDLSGIRGSVIWLEREFKDVLIVEGTSKNNKYAVNADEVVVPYVIAGVRLAKENADSGLDEVLLLPLYGLVSSSTPARSSPNTVYRTSFAHKNYATLRDSLSLSWRPHVARAQMRPGKLEALKDLQVRVTRNGIRGAEKDQIYEDGELIVSPRTLPVFVAKDRNPRTLRFRSQPRTPQELGSEDIDLDLMNDYKERIPPWVFGEFKVVTELHRSATLLGHGSEFERAFSHWLEESLEDPRDAWEDELQQRL